MLRSTLAIASLALLTGHAAAQAVVSGHVVFENTNKPASGIGIWLTTATPAIPEAPLRRTGDYVIRDSDEAAKRRYTKVEPDGSFTIKDVPPGTYLVHTYSPPYLSPDDTIYPTSNSAHVAVGTVPSRGALQVIVTAGQPVKPLSVRLVLGGTIEGTLHAPGVSGSLAGVPVSVERRLGPNHYARTGGAAHTDAEGHYRLEGLGPGDYIVFFAQGMAMVKTAEGSLRGASGLPIYAPHTARPGEAAVVHLAHAETQHLDLDMLPETALHKVTGRVEVDDATALRTVLVRLYPAGEGGLTAATPLAAGGVFSFDAVPDGDYTVSVEFPPTQEFVSADVAKGEVHMRLRPAAYTDATEAVNVAGHDVAKILVRPARAAANGVAP